MHPLIEMSGILAPRLLNLDQNQTLACKRDDDGSEYQ